MCARSNVINHEQKRSRRSFLNSIGGVLGGSWLTVHWPEIARAAGHAHDAVRAASSPALRLLTAEEAAIVGAIAAQIIPTDETPGAREAGVVFFIDEALGTFFAQLADQFRLGLAEFRADCNARHAEVASFSALADAEQIAYLRLVERTPFFASMHRLTVLGMFASPAYGGNRDGVGWKLLGFQDQHVFEPPFGYYDRDYPGFVVEPSEE